LDEGNVWEAILETAVAELGQRAVGRDLKSQSLDRVVPHEVGADGRVQRRRLQCSR